MPEGEEHEVELESLRAVSMEGETENNGLAGENPNRDILEDEDPLASKNGTATYGSSLDVRTKRKLDWLLLPFLAILFLLNSVDKSNIGNAETAGFTRDAGLAPNDLNVSMGYFFAFFVALQPIGAALGRKFGMVRWVPACMSLWGLCTLLHIWVRKKWQLILLRIAIACLESGFYPTTVAYLSLFYTRYEFAVRLSFFYGQSAVAGVLGGVLSWAVFSEYENRPNSAAEGGWKGWQVLFLIEGCLTMFVALLGFVWLPRSAETAWFFNSQEKQWAEQRIRLDHDSASTSGTVRPVNRLSSRSSGAEGEAVDVSSPRHSNEEDDSGEAHHRLLGEADQVQHDFSENIRGSVTADAGLSRQDILSAVLNYKIWHILACNILSAIPATAFGVFLPMVVKQLSPSLNLAPSASNLLSAPPFAFGAIMLLLFASWSDRSKRRLIPIFCGLGLLLVGLTITLLVPISSYILRYFALCVLLSGTFIASPLTVAWLANNTPEPGKRSILLGINGWGNLGGVFLSVLFTPEGSQGGYIRSFVVTLLCALASFGGYVALWFMLLRENKRREEIISSWSEDEKEREDRLGDMPIPLAASRHFEQKVGLHILKRKLGLEESRKGDEKMTFRYGL